MSASRTATLQRHIRQYSEFLGWFIRDLLRYWWMVGFAAGAAAAGLFGQLSSFGLVYQYLRKLRAKEDMVLGPVSFGPANDTQTFIVIVLMVGALLLASVVLEYVGARLSSRFGARYSIDCEKRALLAAAHQNETGGRPLADDDIEMMSRESRIAGIAARRVTDGLAHIVMLPVGLAILVRIDLELAAAVAAVIVAGGAWYYKMSLYGAEQRNRVQKFSAKARGERLALIDHALRGSRPLTDDDPELARAYREGASANFAEASVEQRIVVQKSRFVSNIIIALSLIVVLLFGGTRAMQGEMAWEALLLFAMSLKVTGNSLVGTMRLFVAVNRYYPGLRGYADAVKSHARHGDAASPSKAPVRFVAGDGTSVEAAPGTGIALLAFRGADRATAALLNSTVSGPGSGQSRVSVLPALALPPKGTLRDSYRLQDYTAERLRCALSPLVGAELAGEAATALDLPLSQVKGRLPALGCAIGGLIICEAAPPAAIVAAHALAALTSEEQAALAEAFARAGTALITVYTDPSQALLCGERDVLVSDGETVLSVVPAARYTPEDAAVRTAIKLQQRSQRRRGGALMDEEDLL
ncbi:MAG: hypothetical protein Kow00114_01400 [Kiloniellaceae bacterium]